MRGAPTVLAGLAVTAAAAALYAPTLCFELAGDDYQWMQLARAALNRPTLLLADLDGFWRPSSTWTLAVTHLVLPFSSVAHHAVSLALHITTALLLLAVGRKAGLGLPGATVVTLIWSCSPFASEPVISVASRHETLLLAAWLALALAWPLSELGWSRRRIAGAVACTVLAACSKETWVVTPGIVFVYELVFRRASPRTALRTAGLFAGLAAAYTVVRFLIFPTLRSYFEFSPAILSKVPHELAAFLYLEELMPTLFPFGWRSVTALIGVAAAAAFAIRRRHPAASLGLVLLFLPTLPTLLVPYLPTRYTTIAYAGFLLVAVSAALEAGETLGPTRRRVGTTAFAALAVAALVASVVTVRRELEDAGRVSVAHSRLLREARILVGELPIGPPLVVVRAEAENPLEDVVDAPRGLPKVLYQRSGDAYGLADTAAVFEWALARGDVAFRRLDDDGATLRGVAGTLVVHHAGRFTVDPRPVFDPASVARRWRASGVPVCVVRGETLR